MSSALSLPQSSTGPRGSASRASTALSFAGNGLSRDQIDLLKRTVAKGVTDDELALFVHVANRSGLDPFAKQIHAVRRRAKVDGQYREVMSIQTGIDGFRLIAARTKAHAGTDEAVFEEADGSPLKATVTVWKVVAGMRVAFTASARWSEYVQTYKDYNSGEEKVSGLWAKMPYVMLAKCAEAQALRKAFPADLSGMYAEEEIGAMDGVPVAAPAPGEPESAPRVVDAVPVAAAKRCAICGGDVPEGGHACGEATSPTQQAPTGTDDPSEWRKEVLASFAEFKKVASAPEFDAVKAKAGIAGKTPAQLTSTDIDHINDAMPAPFRLVF